MPQAQRPPSVASLARSLAAPDPVAVPSRRQVAIARPPLRERILLLGLFGALPLLGLATVAAGLMLAQHIATARAELHDRERRNREDLPAEAVLLDAAGCRREMAARPAAAGNLLRARCRLLAEARRWDEVEASAVAATADDPGAILPETRLLLAEAQLALGRPLEAGGQLHRLAGAELDEALRQRLADLSAQVWAASAPAGISPAAGGTAPAAPAPANR